MNKSTNGSTGEGLRHDYTDEEPPSPKLAVLPSPDETSPAEVTPQIPSGLPVNADTVAAGAGEMTPGQRAAFGFIRADKLGGVIESMDFVEGTLTDGGASVTYGQSNVAKTFWIVDLGAAVASGRMFRGELEVERGAVIYVALEGERGARNRIAALRKEGLLKDDDPFFLVFERVSLLEHGHADRLATTVEAVAAESGWPVKLVILDTMARAMAGGDENKGEDMTAAVAAIDAVRAKTGAHVAVVHHSGKVQALGARGHSSLRAAVDTEIEITRPDGESISTVTVTKQRDLPIGDQMPFSLKVVQLGIDRRGKPITSCVVHHESSVMASKPGKKGRPPSGTVNDLLSLLPQQSTTAWMMAARGEFSITATPFYRLLGEIKRQKSAEYTKPGGWVIPGPILGSEFA